MKINMTPSLKQRTIMVGSMQQSIEVLQLPLLELSKTIEHELQENPLLEAEEMADSQTEPINNIISKHLEKNSLGHDGASFSSIYSPEDDEFEQNSFIKIQTLEEYLINQLNLEINDPLKIKIGEFIISHLNEDGYLTCSCEEIAQHLQLPNIKLAEETLTIIQHFDPPGIASRDLKECLSNQIHQKFNGEGALLIKLVTCHLDELSHKRFNEISKKLNISLEEVKSLIQKVAHLEPKPARNFRPLKANIYIKPDITILKVNDGQYSVVVHKEYLPTLKVNPIYQRMLYDPLRSAEEKKFINERIKTALSFIKSIDQRHSTLQQIAQFILDNQQGFFENGTYHLKPMTLKDVAQHLDRNESTISRAINDKYIKTPHGMFSLKYFFAQAITNKGGEEISSRSVKEEIKTMIENENSNKPLSDQDIYEYLANRGMNLSRRTISKYRQALKILPSHLRKV